ncbi:MAG: BRCT domain-containing protein, partial [Acidimicrobiales bacterium]
NYLTGLPARTLDACCDAAGVELDGHHSALADALAAAGLLACYRSLHGCLPPSWDEELRLAALAHWRPVPFDPAFRPLTRTEQAQRRAVERAPLADLVHRLPRGPGAAPKVESYLGVLDRVLEDRMVTADELSELFLVATALGLTRELAQEAHLSYLRGLASQAWEDGEVTSAERTDLVEVARLLGVEMSEALGILDAAREPSPSSAHHSGGLVGGGDRVVFTGDMARSRDELEALAVDAGLRVTGAVSGKTALLVAADPHSKSTKARKARELGIRTVTEQVFLYLVGHR